MNHPLLSRSIARFLLGIIILLSLPGTTPKAQAGNEPTEFFANAPDGTPLHWVVYTPEGTGPWPAVLVIHGGAFKSGTPTSSPESVKCGRDLAAAGMIAFSVEYRLAYPGTLPGQVSDGTFPDQTDDVRLAVIAARSDARTTGKVGVVGGSAGGYQAAFMAASGTVGYDRIDAGVSLSGAYDLSDFSPDPGIQTFAEHVTNYVGVGVFEIEALRAASPAYLADAQTTPLFMINSQSDPMPFSQLADMTDSLDALGVTNYQTLTLPGVQHSFSYWSTIKDHAIYFLTSWFAGIPPTPPPNPSPTPGPSPTPPPAVAPDPSQTLLNVSTRVRVETGASVMIGGFIVTGDVAKKVALRAIGPSLAAAGVKDVLADPVLELYNSSGSLIAQNDNCSSLPPSIIQPELLPGSGKESYITATLPPGSYTAVLRGANGSAGVGLFELFDLDPASSRISNISTRGDVGTGSEVMIGGFIIGGDEPTKVIVRAIGPSLAVAGVPDPLSNPRLELYDHQGSLLFSNDDWRSTQAQQIMDSGVAPTDSRESAIVATLTPGGYTAMIQDAGASSGIALVEVYNLETD